MTSPRKPTQLSSSRLERPSKLPFLFSFFSKGFFIAFLYLLFPFCFLFFRSFFCATNRKRNQGSDPLLCWRCFPFLFYIWNWKKVTVYRNTLWYFSFFSKVFLGGSAAAWTQAFQNDRLANSNAAQRSSEDNILVCNTHFFLLWSRLSTLLLFSLHLSFNLFLLDT